jgi:hypothetical protein
MYGRTLNLEDQHSLNQRARLEDFLTELTFISRKYGILLDPYTDAGVMAVLDMTRDTIIGLDLGYLITEVEPGPDNEIVAYDCENSILDGDWLVMTPEGEKEQKFVDGSEALFWQRRGLRKGHFPHVKNAS